MHNLIENTNHCEMLGDHLPSNKQASFWHDLLETVRVRSKKDYFDRVTLIHFRGLSRVRLFFDQKN